MRIGRCIGGRTWGAGKRPGHCPTPAKPLDCGNAASGGPTGGIMIGVSCPGTGCWYTGGWDGIGSGTGRVMVGPTFCTAGAFGGIGGGGGG